MAPQPTTLLELFRSHPGAKSALILPESNIHISYEALGKQSEDLAETFAALGIGREDRVGMAVPNGAAAIVGLLAASQVGTAAPLNPAYREEEFKFFLEDTHAKILLVPAEGADAARKAASVLNIPTYTVVTDEKGIVTLEGVISRKKFAAPAPDNIALILHTSGSTGRPKRVPLTHANLTISAHNVANTYNLNASDVSMCVMPLFHVHGLVASTLATLATGGTVVVPAKFNPLSFWRTVNEHQATWYSAVPTIHQLLLARSEKGSRPAGAERLRFIRSCSAALPPPVLYDMEAAFGAPVLEAYGMTEAAHQMASNPLPPGSRLPGSVGAGTGVKIGIMDKEGNLLKTGEHGEVVIQGPNVIRGYENNPDANATSFTSGWFRTGDQGFLDEHGYLTLVARIKELIIRGGEKISPREIDEVLLTHPAIGEAVCFGVPHPTWGEEVEAAVVLKPEIEISEKELLAFCRERLSDFKRPKQIHITDAIPRTATGKIQRRAVAESYASKA